MDSHDVEAFGYEEAKEAVDYIGDKITGANLEMPRISLTLGSGLKSFAERYSDPDKRLVIPSAEIPHFARPDKEAAGHNGTLIITPIEKGSKETMAIWAGRIHFYQKLLQKIEKEWITITDPEIRKAAIGFYVAINKLLGIEDILTSNAVGSSNPKHKKGDIVRISDHMMDPEDDFGVPEDPRWFDDKKKEREGTENPYDYALEDYFYSQAQLYSNEIHQLAKQIAQDLGWKLGEGVLNWRKGRGYETVHYVKARTKLGARLFGMSTAPESQKARSIGYSNEPDKRHFAAFALVSNVAQKPNQKLNHQEVNEAGKNNEGKFNPFMYELIRRRVAQRMEKTL